MEDKILVHTLDGCESWTPINYRMISDSQCIILDDEAYSDDDPGLVYAFYPGDVIEVEDVFDEIYQYKATQLISLGNFPDRKYLQFIYKGIQHQMAISESTLIEYKEVIERIRKKIDCGKFVFKGVRCTIDYLDRIPENIR